MWSRSRYSTLAGKEDWAKRVFPAITLLCRWSWLVVGWCLILTCLSFLSDWQLLCACYFHSRLNWTVKNGCRVKKPVFSYLTHLVMSFYLCRATRYLTHLVMPFYLCTEPLSSLQNPIICFIEPRPETLLELICLRIQISNLRVSFNQCSSLIFCLLQDMSIT